MNRIILIGNGFDKAHGLATGYEDFINHYWTNFTSKTVNDSNFNSYEDNLCKFTVVSNFEKIDRHRSIFPTTKIKSFGEFNEAINTYNSNMKVYYTFTILQLNFKNNFFKLITETSHLTNWVDIENEYYNQLKKAISKKTPTTRKQEVIKLNDEFEQIKDSLETYLTNVYSESKSTINRTINSNISLPLRLKDISTPSKRKFLLYANSSLNESHKTAINSNSYEKVSSSIGRSLLTISDPIEAENKRMLFLEELIKAPDSENEFNYIKPNQTLLLNFNYTDTAKELYYNRIKNASLINIHGELNSNSNPIIFGYGDELDETYKTIEDLNDNDFLENIKSTHYHKTDNYRKLLEFIEADVYQVFIMGHSCGNSDRTLLNTLFEHNNCASIKAFYYKKGDWDNYSDITRNISRNFKDKAKMRERVVNQSYCDLLSDEGSDNTKPLNDN